MRVDSLQASILARLVVVGDDALLQAAALCLCRPGVGLVIVCRESGEAAGVITKSDLVRHVTRAGVAIGSVTPLMSQPIISCGPDDDLYGVWQTMNARRLQNLPVLGVDQKPLGVLDIRDAMQALFEHEQFQEQVLVNYIAGIGYR